MSKKIWSDDAWEDYLYWQTQDKKTIKRINQLIKDIERNGCMEGIGKPEPLTGDLQGEYSRRINDKDRLVYHMENGRIYIASLRRHITPHNPHLFNSLQPTVGELTGRGFPIYILDSRQKESAGYP